MKFAVVFGYENQPQVAGAQPAHRAYLASLKESGKLLSAGPFSDESGALMIYEAESEDEVIDLIEHDPFSEIGVFATYLIRPWIQDV